MNYYAIPGLKFRKDSFSFERNRIIKAVVFHFGINEKDVFKKSRKRPICTARQVIMYLMHKILRQGCVEVGNFFKLDHSTALYSFSLVQDLIDTDERFRVEIKAIEESLSE